MFDNVPCVFFNYVFYVNVNTIIVGNSALLGDSPSHRVTCSLLVISLLDVNDVHVSPLTSVFSQIDCCIWY